MACNSKQKYKTVVQICSQYRAAGLEVKRLDIYMLHIYEVASLATKRPSS